MVDWITWTVVLVSAVLVASHVVDRYARQVSRCGRCGADLEVSDHTLELLGLGLTCTLPATCPGCGASESRCLGVPEDGPWAW